MENYFFQLNLCYTIGIILFGRNNDNKTNSNNTLSTQKSNTKSTQSTENKTINLEAEESGNIVIDITNIGSKATFYNYNAVMELQ